MNEHDNKKEHELWFKNEFPDDYLLFIHDSSREALIKFINSEKSWQASANREGYKLVPVDELLRKAQNIRALNVGEYASDEIEENVCEIESMIGAINEST